MQQIKKRVTLLVLLIVMCISSTITTKNPIYICTAADEYYFVPLLNLIGSIFRANSENIGQIAVFDLGLTLAQVRHLNSIEHVVVYSLADEDPNLTKLFCTCYTGRHVRGWYTWKYVVIKRALDMFPYVLWLDAGTTVLKSLDDLFGHIQQNGYFLSTSGDDSDSGRFLHSVGWGATGYVVKKLALDTEQYSWILDQETVMGGIIGVTKSHKHCFVEQMCEFACDLRNFADDGTTPNGLGTGRHDQPLLSFLAYSQQLVIHKQDHTQVQPMLLTVNGQQVPWYITWNSRYINENTCLYSSRLDVKLDYYKQFIRYKPTNETELPIVIIIPSYNNKDFYYENIHSACTQKYGNYRIIYIDDNSPDGTAYLVENYVTHNPHVSQRVQLVKNSERKGALENLYHAIHSCPDNAIIVLLDGDDTLYDENVLSKINNVYLSSKVWITYGQYMFKSSCQIGGAIPIPQENIITNTIRAWPSVPTHVRTFYAGLFKKIAREDLLFDGRFFPMAWDTAMMFPMIEMAAERHAFISDILYIYNDKNPINDHKVDMRLQLSLDNQIRHQKKPYNRLDKLCAY